MTIVQGPHCWYEGAADVWRKFGGICDDQHVGYCLLAERILPVPLEGPQYLAIEEYLSNRVVVEYNVRSTN